jgi:Protein of unknown function (DUF2785)
MSFEELSARLERVVASGFARPDASETVALAREALEALSSPDPRLRDQLAYRVLGEWIYGGVLVPGEVRECLSRAQSDAMLFASIGERGTDSVFRRTYSQLIVAVALMRDNADAFLREEEWRETLARFVRYCGAERDVRAHVGARGWAHAIAHAADTADSLAAGRFAGTEECARLLDALRVLIGRAEEVFQGEEDERVAIALSSMLRSGKVEPAELRAWLHAQAPSGHDETPGQRVQRVNWKLIARSLLLRLQREHQPAARELDGLDGPFSV